MTEPARIDSDPTEKTRQELHWYQIILSTITDPISFVDRGYVYRFVNETYARYARMPRHEIVGRTVAELLGAETFQQSVKPHLDRCFTGQEVHYRAWFDVPGQAPKYMDVGYYPVYDENGTVVGAVANSRDATEQARLHEQIGQYAAELEQRVADRTAELEASQVALLQVERLAIVGKLSASLTHEIGNPLQSVIGCLGLAQEALGDGEVVDEYLQIALTELRRVARIVARLRNLGHPPSALTVKEPTDLNALLDQVLGLCRKKCREQGIEIDNRVDEPLSLPLLVKDQIEQVLLNLMLNAIDAMPGGGRLSIHISPADTPPGVQIVFADTGEGIPAEALPFVFDPFYSTKPENLGLGLSICQDIVEQHGGRLEVESRPGQGSRFTIWLPI